MEKNLLWNKMKWNDKSPPAYPGGAKGEGTPCGSKAKTVKSAYFGQIWSNSIIQHPVAPC